MKLGLGLYRDSLNVENFKFTRQAGATHVVVHLVDYFKGKNPNLSRGSELEGWGTTTNQGKLWTYEELIEIKKSLNEHGLIWEAIENFDMPILINTGKKNLWIYPENNWKEKSLGKVDIDDFHIIEELFLLDVKKVK